MEYYVSYSGGIFVNAENEDEAYELALDSINIDEINVYEVVDAEIQMKRN